MIVLHAAVRDGLLLIWAESPEPQANAPRVRGKQARRAPFDAGAAKLLEAAAELDAGLANRRRALRDAAAWLPSSSQGPVPSRELADAEAVAPEPDRLAQWMVTALPLDVNEALALLAAAIDKPLLRAGLAAGADLRYWAAALRFVSGLVIRGQFLPGVTAGEGARARWQPVVSGADAARMHTLAAAMPGSARALVFEPGDSAPEVPAQAALDGFVECALDALVRFSDAASRPGSLDSPHDQWLHALTARAGAMDSAPRELAALAAEVNRWQRPVRISARAPFRLCLRLEEPPEDSEAWGLRYLLQGSRDPSLLLPASAAWDLKARAAAALGNDANAIREHLLASLGQAARIYPPIEDSLRGRAPEGCALDTGGAHGFLRESAAALEQSGFGVMLPAWWTRRGTQARLKARAYVKSPKLQGGGGLSLEAIVQFDWKLALGDQEVSRSELAALARLKAPLVKLRGQWVEVDAAAIGAALDFLKKQPSGTASVGEIVRMSLGAGPAAGPLEVERVTASGWVADLMAQLEGRAPFEELPPPAGLCGALRPYQLRGYSWLQFLKRWGLGACLADDMGLGKTIQALALILRERAANGAGPVLLVCPTSVAGNWQKEAARFAPDLPVLMHHGAGRRKGEAFAREASRHAIVLSTYALLHRDAEALSGVEWSGVILDEAQNIKNPETKQARAARSLRAAWRVALTGTPVENNVGDLWSLMEFLNPGFLGGQGAFKKRFFIPIQVYGDRGAAERLRRITGPFILRRLKTDKSVIEDLPEKLEMKVFCTLTKEQASLYAAVVKEAEQALESAEGMERKGLVLATLTKLKQVCNHPAQFLKDRSQIGERSGKLSRLAEMLEETLAVGDRSLIFTQFTEMGELIRRHIRESFGREALFLHGGVSKPQRDRMVERFAGEDGPPIFLLSLKAGGTGLNLTRANHVFHFDRWWNPAVEDQATDRAFRIGQTRNVQVHKFLCAGTLEEKIDEMIERKKQVAGSVMRAGEGWLTELSNAELKNLFALRKEALGE